MAGTIVAGALSDGTYSGSVTDTVRGACKAWVNFNGTGTVAIRAAYNVSSITDNGTGDYTVNFTTAMPDVNYAVATSSKQIEANGIPDSYCLISGYHLQSSYSASSYRVVSLRQRYDVQSPMLLDNESVQLAIFR